MTDDHAAHRILPANEPPPAPDVWVPPSTVRIQNLKRQVAELEAENARLRRALDAAGIVRGSDPLLPQVAVEPWDVGDERDYGF